MSTAVDMFKNMIDPTAKPSDNHQTILPQISQGSICYKPPPLSNADLTVMQRGNKLHMDFPFTDSRMVQGGAGSPVGRPHKVRDCGF